MGGGLLLESVGRPPAAIGGGALTKAKGSVMGWVAGGIVAVAAAAGAVCL